MGIKLNYAKIAVHIQCTGSRDSYGVIAAHKNGECTFRNNLSCSFRHIIEARMKVHWIHVDVSCINNFYRSF